MGSEQEFQDGPNFPCAVFVFMEAALRPARSALIIQGDRQ
jgi:hypothetical protein